MKVKRRGPMGVMALALCLVGLGLGATAAGGTTAVTPSNWTVYHGDPQGSGRATSSSPLDPLSPAWTSPTLDGALFGEPLVQDGRVFVATENDSVYALSARTGAVLWRTHLGTPVPARSLPCGDISPTVGITGTPVIDPARHELFVVADRLEKGRVRHRLFGLDLKTGAVVLGEAVDPPGTHPAAQLQRTGLNLDDGQVVFGYGGNFGDCGTYHGWVVAVPERGGPMRTYEVAARAGQDQGAVWMGGAAPEVDGQGHVWVTTGNGSVTNPKAPYDHSNAVLELSPTLHLLHYFAPATWASDNAADLDLGSASPALLADGLVVQAGKSSTGYLLDGTRLGGRGGQLATLQPICQGEVAGGPAVVANRAFLPCAGRGVVAVRGVANPSKLTVLWRGTGGAGGPVVAGREVFSVSSRTGTLFMLQAGTGHLVSKTSVGSVANHFPAPTAADGLLLVAGAHRVVAFDGPDGLPPGPS